MPIKLYLVPESPSVRAIQMTAKALGVELELVKAHDAHRPNFFFQHIRHKSHRTIPLIVDENGFALYDSHATMIYLVEKYGKSDSLYPKDLKKRTMIDQRLFFNSGVFYWRNSQVIRPIIFDNQTTMPRSKVNCVIEAYEFLNKFLKNQQWMAGDSLTIADLCLFASISTSNVLIPIPDSHVKLIGWLQKLKALDIAEANEYGLEKFTKIVKHIIVE